MYMEIPVKSHIFHFIQLCGNDDFVSCKKPLFSHFELLNELTLSRHLKLPFYFEWNYDFSNSHMLRHCRGFVLILSCLSFVDEVINNLKLVKRALFCYVRKYIHNIILSSFHHLVKSIKFMSFQVEPLSSSSEHSWRVLEVCSKTSNEQKQIFKLFWHILMWF